MNRDFIKLWNDKFQTCLEIEFSNPEYFKYHHILVTSYMLQTGRYTEKYQNQAVIMLKNFLLSPDKTPGRDQIHRINNEFSSTKRIANIFNKEVGEILKIPITILNIRTDTSKHYGEDLISWGNAILKEFNNP